MQYFLMAGRPVHSWTAGVKHRLVCRSEKLNVWNREHSLSDEDFVRVRVVKSENY